MYKLSKQNIISPLEKTDQVLIINVLSGNADILSRDEFGELKNFDINNPPNEFLDKGYIVDPDEEYQKYQLQYINFLEERDKEELQLFFVPTYACNFNCSYCYQSGYDTQSEYLKRDTTNKFFRFINELFGSREKYITLFGGEPLLASPDYAEELIYFIEKAKAENIDLSVVTNGYFIDKYIQHFDPSYIREIQITLDGVEAIHDKRRRLKSNSKGTFAKIVDNIDLCLEKGLTVNLRTVVDRDNLYELPELANFAIRKGWVGNPHFKTQIGRNYELHYCQDGKSRLFDRISLYQELQKLIAGNPQILQYHKPSFSVIKFLEENGELPQPLFDACPACKSEWAMDYTGSVYSCTATVGKPGEKLGDFYPEINLNHDKINKWQQRDVLHIEQCKECDVQLVCGGGCGSIAFNQNKNLLSPDCRPVKELAAMGTQVYFLSDLLLQAESFKKTTG